MSLRSDTLLAALAAFDPIGLEETNGQAALMRRVDAKYVLRPDQLLAILPSWAATHRILEIDTKRIARYHSVYYDTANRSLYLAHHAGAANRVKFRIREYTDSNLRFYEVKVRSNNGITDKQRSRLRDSTVLSALLEQSVTDHPRHLGGEPVQESLQIDYDRITLVSRTGSERVTIDLNLVFKSEARSVLLEDRVIIEIKHERGTRSPLDRQLRSFGIRSGSISKYCLGILQLYPDVKQNRFKLPLRILAKQLRPYGIAASRGGSHENQRT